MDEKLEVLANEIEKKADAFDALAYLVLEKEADLETQALKALLMNKIEKSAAFQLLKESLSMPRLPKPKSIINSGVFRKKKTPSGIRTVNKIKRGKSVLNKGV